MGEVPAAAVVAARLREMCRLLAARGFVTKGVDMSPAAIHARLATWSALSEMCRRLGARPATSR